MWRDVFHGQSIQLYEFFIDGAEKHVYMTIRHRQSLLFGVDIFLEIHVIFCQAWFCLDSSWLNQSVYDVCDPNKQGLRSSMGQLKEVHKHLPDDEDNAANNLECNWNQAVN